MKKLNLCFVLMSVVYFSAFLNPELSAQNNAEEKLYQEALLYMEGMGDYEEAVKKFETIANEYGYNETLAARSLLMLGKAYEKLGSQQAGNAYNRIIEKYSNQTEIVLEARSRLLALAEGAKNQDSSGMVVRQVWAGSNVDIMGAPSPDESFLSFVDWSTGDLAIRDLSTGEISNLTDNESWAKASGFAQFSIFSPDGKTIAYAWWDEEKRYWDLRLKNVENKTEHIIFQNEEYTYVQPADWSSDGQHIAFTARSSDRTNQIALISPEDGTITILKSLDWRYPEKMSFSPDGRFLAYDFPPVEDRDDRNIYVIDLINQSESVLVDHQSINTVYGWTPDGNHLVFSSNRTGNNGIWLLAVENGNVVGEPELLKSDIGRHTLPMGFTENGSFYFGQNTGGQDVYTSSIDLSTGQLVGSPERVSGRYIGKNRHPDWSPDGKYLAYVSARDRRFNRSNTIVIQDVETGQERTLMPDLNFFFQVHWSPVGKSFVVVGTDTRGRQGIYVINTTTGEISDKILSDPAEHIYQPVFSSDGNHLYYLTNKPQEKKYVLTQRNMETGDKTVLHSTTLPDQSVNNMFLSDQGDWLAFKVFERDIQKLAVVPLNSIKPEVQTIVTLKDPISLGDIISFRNNEIIFLKYREKPDEETIRIREMWTVDLDTGNTRKLGQFTEDALIGSTSLHPHQDKISYTYGQRKYEVWAIENFLPELKVADN